MCPRPRPTVPVAPGTIPGAPCCCGRPGRHPAPEPHGPLTLAILVQAVVGSAVPAGQAEPREERLEHGQVTAVEGQVAGEGAQADCQGAAVGGRGPTPGRGTRDAREAARGREGQDGTSGQSLCVQGRQARPEPPRQRPFPLPDHCARAARPGGAHSLQHVGVLLQEGDGRWRTAGDILVGELHELADEGGQVAGGLSVVLQRGGGQRGASAQSRRCSPAHAAPPGGLARDAGLHRHPRWPRGGVLRIPGPS